MSIQIVPTIDDYITHFMSLDISIPKMFTETSELISEYLDDFKVSYFYYCMALFVRRGREKPATPV